MKVLVKYNPDIHQQLCKSLDKEIQKSKQYTTDGVSHHTILKKREINIAGKTIDLTKGLRDKVDGMSSQNFLYSIRGVGEIEITFKSINDKMPFIIRKTAEKLMMVKIKSELRKEFKQDILSVSKVEG
jgi:hypothetical protein